LLAVRPAFNLRDRPKLIEQVLHEEPPRLRKLNPAVPRDLETIVHKAIAKEAEQRYPRAAALAADLQRFLDDRPIQARPVGAPERLWRWCRRNPAVASLTSLVVLVAVSGFAATIAQVAQARIERDDARRQRDKVTAINNQLRPTLYDSDMNQVQSAWELNNTPRFFELLRRQRPEEGLSDLRGFEWQYWQRLGHAEERSFRLPIEGTLEYVSFSRDGKRVAIAYYRQRNADFDTRVRIFDTETAAELVTPKLGQSYTVSINDQRPCLSPDGTRLGMLLDWGPRSELSTWDVATDTQLSKVQFPELSRPRSLAFSLDGERVALTYGTGPTRQEPGPYVLTVRETATGIELQRVTVPCYRLQFPVFSPDGKRVATVSRENTTSDSSVRVWDVASGQELTNVHTGRCICAAFSPDGQLLVTGGGPADSEVLVWEVATGKCIRALPEPTGAAFHVMFSPDGKRLGVVGSTPPTAMVWDLDPAHPVGLPMPIVKITGHTQQISWLGFSADSRRVYSADKGGTVKVWDTAPPPRLFDVNKEGKPSPLTIHLLSPDASRLAVLEPVGPDYAKAQIVVYDSAGKRLGCLDQIAPGLIQSGGPIRLSMAFSADGRRLVTHAPADGKTVYDLQVYDTATGKKLVTIAENDQCHSPAFSPDDRILAAGLKSAPPRLAPPGAVPIAEHGFKIWDAVTGQEIHRIEAGGVDHPPFSPDGRFLAWVVKSDPNKRDCEVRVWETATGKERTSMRKQFDEALGQVAFSPDGRTCAALVSRPFWLVQESEVKVWDAASGEDRVTLVGNFHQFAFNPDGRRIATNGGAISGAINSARGEVKVWDTTTGRELLTLRTAGLRSHVVFSPDGNRLLAVKNSYNDPGGLVQVWDATPVPEAPEPDERK
jgi:WD40 repeat protein